MNDYIEREAVISRLEKVDMDAYYGFTAAVQFGVDHAIQCIKEAPAADVAPVVRCKECRHSSLPSGFTQRYGEPGTLSCHFGPCNRRNVNGNDFCSYGQRKEDEQ